MQTTAPSCLPLAQAPCLGCNRQVTQDPTERDTPGNNAKPCHPIPWALKENEARRCDNVRALTIHQCLCPRNVPSNTESQDSREEGQDLPAFVIGRSTVELSSGASAKPNKGSRVYP